MIDSLVTFVVLVQQRNGFGVATLRFVVTTHLPVELGQAQSKHALFDTIAFTFLSALLVSGNCRCGVLSCQMDITHGKVDLVQIFFVLGRFRHLFESLDHPRSILTFAQYFRLQNLSVEGKFIRRT